MPTFKLSPLKWIIFLLIVSCIFLYLAFSPLEYPDETSYFDLLGISKDSVDRIEFYYQPLGLPETFDAQLAETLSKDSPEDLNRFEETLTALDCRLKKVSDLDYDTVKEHFLPGAMQAVLYAGSDSYSLPVFDIYERTTSGSRVSSWVLADQTQFYQIMNLLGSDALLSVEEPYERGLGTRLFHYAGYQSVYDPVREHYMMQNPYSDLAVTRSPLLYMLDLPTGPLAGYTEYINLKTVFSRSSQVFSGEIMETAHTPDETYTIRIEEVWKGTLQPDHEITFSDHKGYYPDVPSYSIRNNDSERALRAGGHYLFFMKGDTSSLLPTERYYGICEIIDGHVWPLCNTLPSTAWVQGETAEELMQRLQP